MDELIHQSKANQIEYFINKFKTIPSNNWHIGNLISSTNPKQKCALGHCFIYSDSTYYVIKATGEIEVLLNLFTTFLGSSISVAAVNDGDDDYKELVTKYHLLPQKHPKDRVLQILVLMLELLKTNEIS